MSRRRYGRDDFGRDLALLGFAAEVPFAGIDPARRRRWRFDWCYDRPPVSVAVEYQGVMRTTRDGADPSHASLAGLLRDMEKWTEASLAGFILVLVNAKTVEDGRALGWVMAALGEES